MYKDKVTDSNKIKKLRALRGYLPPPPLEPKTERCFSLISFDLIGLLEVEHTCKILAFN